MEEKKTSNVIVVNSVEELKKILQEKMQEGTMISVTVEVTQDE